MPYFIALLYIFTNLCFANPILPDSSAPLKIIAEYRTNTATKAAAPAGVAANETSEAKSNEYVYTSADITAAPEQEEYVKIESATSESTNLNTAEPTTNNPTTNEPTTTTSTESAVTGTPTEPAITVTPSESAITDEKPVIDAARIDYKKELINLGFYNEEGKDKKLNLRNAVLRFQSYCNMKVNGNWDNKCLKALISILTDNEYAEDKIAKPASEGMWIAINKSKRILTLYEGTYVLKKYPVAIGNPSSLTPEGKFRIVNKIVDPYWGGGGFSKPIKGGLPSNPLGHRWLGLSYKTGSDLGVHGNNSPFSIGKNISHGCIRMINPDVEELFEVVPRSTDVWIGTAAELKAWGVEQPEITASAPVNR